MKLNRPEDLKQVAPDSSKTRKRRLDRCEDTALRLSRSIATSIDNMQLLTVEDPRLICAIEVYNWQFTPETEEKQHLGTLEEVPVPLGPNNIMFIYVGLCRGNVVPTTEHRTSS